VISKDTDFFYSHLLQGRPWKLLLVKTGNISTRALRDLFERSLPAIEVALQGHTLVEIDRASVRPVA
jgi:predicted nuclease of predicted toxin-antitoxin system